jgi:ribonuclease-3
MKTALVRANFDMTLIYPRRQQQLQRLVRRLGLSDTAAINWQLLDQAMTHPTVSPTFNNDRLEFVGDAVVRMATSELLWELYPECSVGEFTAIRSILVSDRSLARLATTYDLAAELLVSGSAVTDQVGETSRLAQAFEALLGALYLSTHTLELIRPWLDPQLQKLAADIRNDPACQNYKAALQEWTQAHYKVLPEYCVQETGTAEDQAQRFTAEVWLQGELLATGKGRSIKTAEQDAARQAFLKRQS